MSNYLRGGYTTALEDEPMRSLSKIIQAININPDMDNMLIIAFEDNARLRIVNETSCSERRYWHTDDDLSALCGAKLVGFAVKEGPTVEEDVGTHETAFLEIIAREGSVVFSAHNEHNGYYSGIKLRWEEDDGNT